MGKSRGNGNPQRGKTALLRRGEEIKQTDKKQAEEEKAGPGGPAKATL